MSDTLARLRAEIPSAGLFAEKDWLLSPEPLRLDAALVEELEKLGHRLAIFQRASNELYQRSANGKAPAWVADYLDRGKPPELIEFARRKQFRGDLPQVIRPDLLLTAEGFAISELDSVPGGIGLTAWLGKTYAALGFDIVGGAEGMLAGFRSVLGENADILVSEESATYRPEMQWLTARANETGAHWSVLRAEEFNSEFKTQDSKFLYRFFEQFDLPNIPAARAILDAAANGTRITPPFKPWLEEKMWLALFWSRPLREFWRRELSERNFLILQKHIPQSWILDPAPLPHHAVLPWLNISSWDELKTFSQKERDFVLKVSGFSPEGWGSRGVTVAADVPQTEWAAAIDRAIADFPHHPQVLMRFAHSRIVEHPYFDPATGEVRTMRGRVRLCPYYFVTGGDTKLGGILATIVPADKKLVHGMRDAILVPVAVAAS
ncbi:MAG: hypothetical protein ABIP20_01360 [Chthoniobacteraceae bacterium]